MQDKLSAQPPALLSFLLQPLPSGTNSFGWKVKGGGAKVLDPVFQCLGVGPLTKPSGMLLECGQVAFLAFLWGLPPPSVQC